jgi:hypothetical protein
MITQAVTNNTQNACNCCDDIPFQNITSRFLRREGSRVLSGFSGFKIIEECPPRFDPNLGELNAWLSGKTRVWTRSNVGTQTRTIPISGGTTINNNGPCETPKIETITPLTVGSIQTVTTPPSWTAFTSAGAGSSGEPTRTETSIVYGPRNDGNVDSVIISNLWTNEELYQSALNNGNYGFSGSTNWVADLNSTALVGNGIGQSDGLAFFSVSRPASGTFETNTTVIALQSFKFGIRFVPPITCYLRVWYTLETVFAINGIITSVEECDFGTLEFKNGMATFYSDHFNLTKQIFEGGNTCRGTGAGIVEFLLPEDGIEVFPKLPPDNTRCNFTTSSNIRIQKWSNIEGYEPVYTEVLDSLGNPNTTFRVSTTKNGNPLGDVR